MEDETERVLKLATTDRHAADMKLSGLENIRYLVGSIGHNRSAYEVGYRMVNLWSESGCFRDVDVVELYITSRIALNLGAIDAFDEIGIPVRIMEYVPEKGSYRSVGRKREVKLERVQRY